MNPLNINKKQFFLGILMLIVFIAMHFSHFSFIVYADDSSEEIEDDISSVEKKIEKEKAEKAKLESELSKIQKSVSNTQSQINQTEDLIKKAEDKIKNKEEEIIAMNEKIDLQKEILKGFIQEVYYRKKEPVISISMFKGDFSSVFGAVDKILNVESKILEISQEIRDTKEKIKEESKEIEAEKDDHEKLLNVKVVQQRELLNEKSETQADIQEKEKTISQLQSKLNSLKSELSKVLGKSVSTDDILEAASFAAKATGMNKSFLLGVLVQESNKGQYTGGCDYKESKMSDYRKEIFKDICEELDYNYKKMKVSCPPKSYSGTGGAMGVAQFMSDTWWGYKDRIAALTGNNPPDPWDLVDGVTAMAIKLSNDGASKKERFYEAKSYCVYLAGGNWGYYCYGSASKYKKSYENVNCWGSSIVNYGEKVLCLKDNYEQFYD